MYVAASEADLKIPPRLFFYIKQYYFSWNKGKTRVATIREKCLQNEQIARSGNFLFQSEKLSYACILTSNSRVSGPQL